MPATLRSFTQFILYSRLRAISVAFAITFIPIIGTISIVITGLITLRKGALDGFWVLIAATLPYIMLLPFQPLPLGLWVISIIILSNIFTWLLAILLKHYHHWNFILEIAALIGVILITTAHVIKPDLETWWEKQLGTYLTQVLNGESINMASAVIKSPINDKQPKSNQSIIEDSTEPDVINFINAAKSYASGILIASILFTALLQLFASRWWQVTLDNPLKLREELCGIRLTSLTGFVFLLSLILSYIKFTLALDLLPVLYLTFCLAGLSLVHYTANKFKAYAGFYLLMFYGVLLISWLGYKLPLVFQLVAMAALLDTWFDWRGRLDKRLT